MLLLLLLLLLLMLEIYSTNLLFLKMHLLRLKLHLPHLVGNGVMGSCPYFLQEKLAPSIGKKSVRHL
jgi:hypothetical protein